MKVQKVKVSDAIRVVLRNILVSTVFISLTIKLISFGEIGYSIFTGVLSLINLVLAWVSLVKVKKAIKFNRSLKNN